MTLWRELGVNSWPTFAIVGPNGKLIAQISGEGHRKVLMTISKFSHLYIKSQLSVLVLNALLFCLKNANLNDIPMWHSMHLSACICCK